MNNIRYRRKRASPVGAGSIAIGMRKCVYCYKLWGCTDLNGRRNVVQQFLNQFDQDSLRMSRVDDEELRPVLIVDSGSFVRNDHLIDAVKLVAIREFSESFQIAPRIDIHNLQIATVSSIVPKGFPAETISRMMRIEKTHHLGICWRMRDSAH